MGLAEAGERVGVKEALAVHADAAEEAVVKGAFEHVDVPGVAAGEEQPLVPQDVGDAGAGLGVGGEVGQLVGGPERLAAAGRADGAGEVKLGRDGVGPKVADGLGVRRVAGHRGDVGHAGVEVAGAHGVADGLALVHDRQMVLRVLAVKVVPVRPAAGVEEELGEREVLVVAGGAGELDEADLDLLVAGRVLQLVGAEDVVHQVGVLDRRVEQGAVAGRLPVGDGGLVEVAGIVKFVLMGDVGPAVALAAQNLRPAAVEGGAGGVEVAVVLLRGGDAFVELVAVVAQLRVRLVGQRVGGALDHLVDVAVVVERPAVGRPLHAGGGVEVFEAAGLVALLEGVADRVAVGVQPRLPKPLADVDGGERHGRDRVPGGGGDVGGLGGRFGGHGGGSGQQERGGGGGTRKIGFTRASLPRLSPLREAAVSPRLR